MPAGRGARRWTACSWAATRSATAAWPYRAHFQDRSFMILFGLPALAEAGIQRLPQLGYAHGFRGLDPSPHMLIG